MAHLTSISLENFRAFKKEENFDFAPITILTGTNSSGKSSLINALSVLSNLFKKTGMVNNFNHFDGIDDIFELEITDIGERLGDFSKLINRASGSDTFSFSLNSAFKGIIDKVQIKFELKASASILKTAFIKSLSIRSAKTQKEILSINQDDGEWRVRVDYLYFLKEYKRESKQIFKFYEVDEKAQELEREPDDHSDAAEIKIKLNLLYDELEAIHPEFAYLKFNTSIYDNVDTVFQLRNTCYLPFFSDQLENSKHLFYREGQPLFSYFLPDRQKDSDNFKDFIEGMSELGYEDFKEYIIDAEEEFLSDFEFIVKGVPSYQKPLSYIFGMLSRPIDLLRLRGVKFSGCEVILPAIDENNALLKFSQIDHTSILDGPTSAANSIDAEDRNSGAFLKDFVLGNILNAIDFGSMAFKTAEFIGSIRSLIKRNYSAHKGETELEKILNMFLRKGTYNILRIKKFVDKYLNIFGIGKSFLIKNDEGVTNRVYLIDNNGEEILLADLGYGISQFIPILLKIAVMAQESYDEHIPGGSLSSTLCIEEPETNLHPAFQSLLADLFADAYKTFSIQFIIETHSEYLIRKLQYLTGVGGAEGITKETTQIYYFNPEPEGLKGEKVKKINIKEDGSLNDDFGPGFFDEAIHWQFKLLDLKNSQKN